MKTVVTRDIEGTAYVSADKYIRDTNELEKQNKELKINLKAALKSSETYAETCCIRGKQIKIMRDALEFYADEDNWELEMSDGGYSPGGLFFSNKTGKRAKKALLEIENE